MRLRTYDGNSTLRKRLGEKLRVPAKWQLHNLFPNKESA